MTSVQLLLRNLDQGYDHKSWPGPILNHAGQIQLLKRLYASR